MIQKIKKTITNNAINIPGWRTNRKIVVIESDDWGSIRMPSKEVYNKLLKEGYKPDTDPYLKYDSLASEEDLIALFEVLSSVKDKHGNPAVMTANCVVANPDFKRIKESGFRDYHYELFTETLKRYPNHQNSFNLWQQGMNANLFHPQFHGREHFNVDRWMSALQKGDELLLKAFNCEMISISSMPSKMRFGYMESLDYFNKTEEYNKQAIIIDGLNLFEKAFGYRSKSFIASCYIWSDSIEPILKENGVGYIQGIFNQIIPELKNEKHTHRYKKHFLGTRNNLGQHYLIRNAFFEPSQSANTNEVNECLRRINMAFKWQKPAIIGSHRLNFIGSINEANRKRNLESLKALLHHILKQWPDVEFLSSDSLGDLINKV